MQWLQNKNLEQETRTNAYDYVYLQMVTNLTPDRCFKQSLALGKHVSQSESNSLTPVGYESMGILVWQDTENTIFFSFTVRNLHFFFYIHV